MAWNTPKTWSTGNLVTATEFNQQLRDNLLYLKQPPVTRLGFQSLATSSTTYTPIHETQNIVTTAGGRVLCLAWGQALQTGSSANRVFITLYVDNVKLATPNDDGLVQVNIPSTAHFHTPWCIAYMTDTLEAAFHTFRFHVKVNTAASALVYMQQMWLLEV